VAQSASTTGAAGISKASLHFATVFGHDTINLGAGNDTVFAEGQASALGSAQMFQTARSATLIGSAAATEFIRSSAVKPLGLDSATGTLGIDSVAAAGGKSVFEFIGSGPASQVITNFVAGHDKLYIEGYSLSYLQQHADISSHSGNTYISLSGGKTTIELQGVDHLKPTDFTTHK
jgi:Ca2+-binding RTX toxin-like protein